MVALTRGEHEAKLHQALALLSRPDTPVIVTDETGVIERWSRTATEAFGWRSEEAVGRMFADFAGLPEDRSFLADRLPRLRGGEIRLGERGLIRADGSPDRLYGFSSIVAGGGQSLIVALVVPVARASGLPVGDLEEEEWPQWRSLAERALHQVSLEEAERSLGRITAFSRSLARTEELQEVLDRVAREMATAAGSPKIVVYLRSESNPDHLTVAAANGVEPGELRGFRQRDLGDPDSPNALAVLTGQPVWFESPEEKRALFPGLAARGDAMKALAVLPLVADAEPIGAVGLAYRHRRRFRPADRVFLTGLADLAAQAVARARMRTREQHLVATLQRAVLPVETPRTPGVEVAARYLPADDAAGVGGDWWDAFLLPNGRLGLAVGDVAGHGLPAAGAMAKLRNGLRAYLFAGYEPGDALGLAEAFIGASGRDIIATVAAGTLDPATGLLIWAHAGHLPPLLAGPSGTHFLEVQETDPILGVAEGRPRSTRSVHLTPGTLLTLYTDGLVESRRRDVEAGLVLLRHTAGELPTEDPEAFAEAVVHRLAPTGDDVCLLVVRYSGAAG